ncbi:MAG: hypothetical protein HS115_16550 [Spirochaetales bacterium]|nr:hypothetical protein [Spirochaetales bacterium]
MELQEVQALNARLKAPGDISARPFRICLDTIRHPYLLFAETLHWPAVSLDELRFAEAGALLDTLIPCIGPFLKNGQVLPQPRPRKESSHLHIIFYYPLPGLLPDLAGFILILRILGPYMGGAQTHEMLAGPRQGRSPAFHTDRLYFQSRLFPVKEIQQEAGAIVDFEPLRLRETLFKVSVAREEKNFWASALFDDVDFSHLETGLLEPFLDGQILPSAAHFKPIMVDYFTIALNLLCPDPELARALLPPFRDLLLSFLQSGNMPAPNEELKNFWQKYLLRWQHHNALSRSGNPHWEVSLYPDLSWVLDQKYV